MYGDNIGQIQDDTVVQPMDPSVISDPASSYQPSEPAAQHIATPAFSDDTQVAPDPSPVQQMHQDAVTASQGSAQAMATGDDDLLAIKQEALTALTPLVGNLDQPAEEKFRTTMMLIQASDDRSLVRQAYEAAQAIEDEKVKAQALLDVVNEINYFTSHNS